jgi:hypothetical protein
MLKSTVNRGKASADEGLQMTAMNTSSQYAINGPDVVAEDFEGQIVILNLANGHYFALSGIASPIWSRLVAGHNPQSIIASIESTRPDLSAGALAFMGRLVELNLVRPHTSGADESPEPIKDAWLGETPEIEVFNDLAELIFADPIHDVDERVGWPTPRQAR